MFKSGRWRGEKNKFKVGFKLQFHAAQVPVVGEDALMISVVPADAGKPTVKSDRAAVRDGSCFWENPVYETVKFNRDPRSGKIHERIYYFVVGTGSSKSGIIGEASIDFSNYAEATKVCLVSLPLKNSKTDAVLNVSIQRIHDSVDQREVEETENAKLSSKDHHSLRSQFRNGDVDGNAFAIVPFNKPVSTIAEMNGNRQASIGSDITMSSSESSSGNEIPWIGSGALEVSIDDSSSTPRETIQRLRLKEASDVVLIDNLRSEVAALSRQAGMSELELQTLRKQIVKETKRAQDQSKELVCLKEERDALKLECGKLEAKTRNNSVGDSLVIVEELRQELYHAKELNSNLRIQLEKMQESNSELVLAVQDLDEILEQKNKEIMNLSSGTLERSTDNRKLGEARTQKWPHDDNDDDEEQKALEDLVKEHDDAKEAYVLEQQIMDMRSEIEIYKRDKDEFEMQMEQLALDYEIMKQENHEMAYKLEQSQIQEQLKMQYECSSSYGNAHELAIQIENLENELKGRSKESADAFVKVSELEAHVKSLQEELEKQSQGFNAEVGALTRAKVEQEQKAKKAEELELQIENLEKEMEVRSQEAAEALMTISELEHHVERLEAELEKQSQGYKTKIEGLTSARGELERRAKRVEELEIQIEDLQNELKIRSTDAADALITISELEAHIMSLEEEHEKQSQVFDADVEALTSSKSEIEQRAKELEIQVEILEVKLKLGRKEFADALVRISELEAHVKRLEEQLERQSHGFVAEQDRMAKSGEELKIQIENLENELRSRSLESKDAFIKISELEAHAKILEEELEKQSQGFEADLEALMQSKVEQEQRAIRAEETLRKTKWQNAKTAERLQEEFRRLSLQMACTFEANEKLAAKAVAEANEIRLQKCHLEEMMQKASEGHQAVKAHYEARLHQLSSQVISMTDQIEQMQSEIGTYISKNKILSEEVDSKEILMNELEQMRLSITQGGGERIDLENKVMLVKNEAEDLQKGLTKMRYLVEEKETIIQNLQSELSSLQAQYMDLKNSLLEDELEKEKSIKDGNDQDGSTLDAVKTNSNVVERFPHGSKEVLDLKERIKLLEGELESKKTSLGALADTFLEKEKDLHSNIAELEERLLMVSQNSSRYRENEVEKDSAITQLKNEMNMLKEKNISMEGELKEMQERYSELSLKFAEIEGERQQLMMRVRSLKNGKKKAEQNILQT